MNKTVALVPGDGIGVDITIEAVNVLEAIAKRFGHNFEFKSYDAGGVAIDKHGEPLPAATLEGCQASDAVILGSVGGPKWDDLGGDMRPEKALLGLRSGLGLFCNLRPAVLLPQLRDACMLKPEIIGDGLDIMVVRELTGGIYFGKRGRNEAGDAAFDTLEYSVPEVERIVRLAFEIAQKRQKRLCSVDKHNILETSRLWRETANRVAKEFPDVALTHMYVDNAAMQLVRDPRQFDVIVTGNMFGDILSDEASMITGSIGMLPSASLRSDNFGMYEPIHGSAPDIAGKNIANPLAMILSVAMLLRHTFELEEEAVAVETAVSKVLDTGLRTVDIAAKGENPVGTKEMGAAVVAAI